MTNPYAPPAESSEGVERRQRPTEAEPQPGFYRVPVATLIGLHIVTFGLYSVYWFYRHWDVQKRVHRLQISPLARGLFSLFFVHRLFEMIDRGARATGLSPTWRPESQATAYVGLVIGARILGQLPSSTLTPAVFEIVLSITSALPLAAAQKLANQSSSAAALEVDEDDDQDEEDSESEDEEDGESEDEEDSESEDND